jgi:hypothetical protein
MLIFSKSLPNLAQFYTVLLISAMKFTNENKEKQSKIKLTHESFLQFSSNFEQFFRVFVNFSHFSQKVGQ